MTQEEQIMQYVTDKGIINPATMGGKVVYGRMFGSETTRACRALRKAGELVSLRDGKFVVFVKPGDETKYIKVNGRLMRKV